LLPRPAGGRSAVTAMYRALGEEVTALRALASDVRDGRGSAESADAARTSAASARYRASARAYGFTRCGASAGAG
jgi:hypothetical protein